ncbi:MAG: hypothetical protein E7545_08350 [Ruminococcaceae bacterium]|nr:hypothetical protein [Oscillospiraceae bacterium]
MKSNKLSNNKNNCFLGGYITYLKRFDGIDGDERKYISIKMKDGDDTIDIMVFKESGYKNKKYPNPLVKLVIDAYEQKIPIACVYNEQPESNVMECVYTNFSVNAAVAEKV